MKKFFIHHGPFLRKIIGVCYVLLFLYVIYWLGSLWPDCFQERQLSDPLQTELCEMAIYAVPWLLLSICLTALMIGFIYGKKWADIAVRVLTAAPAGYFIVSWIQMYWWPTWDAAEIPLILLLLFVATFLPRSHNLHPGTTSTSTY